MAVVTVLVDPARNPAHGRLWAHLVSDTSLAELHAFAALLGLPPRSFEGDHYDVPAELVDAAVRQGATPVDTRELLTRLKASGLRTPKRRGEKVLASSDPGDGSRVDLVRAPTVALPHGPHVLTTAAGAGLGLSATVDGRRVLGFRRTWSRARTGVVVDHEGVLLAGPGEGPQGPGAQPLAGGAPWWLPLLQPDDAG